MSLDSSAAPHPTSPLSAPGSHCCFHSALPVCPIRATPDTNYDPQQAAASDSEDYSGDLSDDGDEMLPGSDSGSDDGVDYDDVAAAAAVVGGRSKKQPAVRDIAALAAAAQQQAADYAARQKKALAAAGGVPLAAAADEEEEEGEEESGSEDMDDAGGGSSEEGDDAAAGKRPHIYNAGKGRCACEEERE